MNKMLGATEFKTHFLRLIKEIERTGEPVTVTHRGEPVVEIRPAPRKAPNKLLFGCMKGWVAPDFTPEESAYDGPWNAELDSDKDDPGSGGR